MSEDWGDDANDAISSSNHVSDGSSHKSVEAPLALNKQTVSAPSEIWCWRQLLLINTDIDVGCCCGFESSQLSWGDGVGSPTAWVSIVSVVELSLVCVADKVWDGVELVLISGVVGVERCHTDDVELGQRVRFLISSGPFGGGYGAHISDPSNNFLRNDGN